MKLVWYNLILTPVWFLLSMIGVSYVLSHYDTITKLPECLQETGPLVMFFGLIATFLFLLWSSRKEKFDIFKEGWYVRENLLLEITGGVAVGLIMAILYFAFFAHLQIDLQNRFGDYVTTGETASILIKNPIFFGIVNILMAPFIEETLFRSYVLKSLSPQFKPNVRMFISATGFGLLHLLGGFWYVLMTGYLVGLPLAYFAEKRKNIVWTFAAHTTLNILEVIYFYF